jgi:hypothetical protein
MGGVVNQEFSGSRRLQRMSKCIDKTLAVLGKSVDLFSADFNAIEKLACLIHMENILRRKVAKTNNSFRAQNMMCELLIKITDNYPVVDGFLNKSRLFELVNNTWNGHRLLQKPNLRYMVQSAFPHCFIYDMNDVSDVKMGEIVKMMEFLPPVSAPASASMPASVPTKDVSSNMINFDYDYVVLGFIFVFTTFVSGAIYSCILLTGVNSR